MKDPFSIAYARELDGNDPLRHFRKRFVIRDPSLVYLDGNSLGRLPVQTVSHMEGVIQQQWGDRLIRSWNEGWYQQPDQLGEKIARLIGARPDEVVLSDATSVNLYKLAYGALKWMDKRTEIISDDLNFPSDLYIIQGLIRQFGNRHTLRLVKSADGVSSDMTDLLRMISSRTALVTLSHVAYKSAYMYDLEKVTELAHMHGVPVLWDLSHSVGAVPVNLNKANADLAVGCTYKYLNGGPGSPAFLYVRKDLQEKLENPIWGWFGEKNPFDFKMNYRVGDTIRKFLTGTPPVVSASALGPALDLVLEAGVGALRQKSADQTGYLISLASEWLFSLGFRLGSPEISERRGSHVSLKHAEAYRICRALTDPDTGGRSMIPDFREPNNIRLGISPLYNTYEEIFVAMEQLRMIMEFKLYEKYPGTRDLVT